MNLHLMLPTLRTDRIELRPLGPEHLDELADLDSDPEVMRYLTGRGMSREEAAGMMPRRTDGDRAARGLGYWSGFVDDEFVGWWQLVPPEGTDPGNTDDLMLGYRLKRAHWRRGLASEGSEAVLRYAFDQLDAPRVLARTMATNLGSRGVMRRLGMVYLLTQYLEWDDPLPTAELGDVTYGITAAAWRERQRETAKTDGKASR